MPISTLSDDLAKAKIYLRKLHIDLSCRRQPIIEIRVVEGRETGFQPVVTVKFEEGKAFGLSRDLRCRVADGTGLDLGEVLGDGFCSGSEWKVA